MGGPQNDRFDVLTVFLTHLVGLLDPQSQKLSGIKMATFHHVRSPRRPEKLKGLITNEVSLFINKDLTGVCLSPLDTKGLPQTRRPKGTCSRGPGELSAQTLPE